MGLWIGFSWEQALDGLDHDVRPFLLQAQPESPGIITTTGAPSLAPLVTATDSPGPTGSIAGGPASNPMAM